MDQHKTTAVDTSITCPHTYKRVTREASHLYKIGAGGYFQVGVFDTTVTCRDCKEELYTVKKDAPLCQSCLAPLTRVSEINGVPSCDDILTDSLLFGKNLSEEKAQQQARLDRYWDWHCAREEREEERCKGTPNEMSSSESMTRSGVRILRRSIIKQIWPYTCTSSNCDWQGKLIWLHTPGD